MYGLFATRTLLVVVAACWLAAGPGGIVLKAALACAHASMQGHHGHMDMGHGAHMPGDGPCFCSGMVGAFDQTVSVAVPLSVPSLPTVAPVFAVANACLFPLPPSPAVVPETPPPIAA